MRRKMHKKRLEKPKKQYALDQCALYGIKGMGQLGDILGMPVERAVELAEAPDSYKVWPQGDRMVQEARPKLRSLHARIATLLRRIEPPAYRQSGVRSRSFLTNAKKHRNSMPILKMDVSKFYPSTVHGHVWRFFRFVMKCSPDVADVLAKVCCFRRLHLPTGGVHSEVLAFYCHKRMLDLLDARVKKRGGVMTVYVDDIVVSMPSACQSDLDWARRLMAQVKLTMNVRKSRVIRASVEKMITGVSVHRGQINAPASQHRRIKELYQAIAAAKSEEETISAIRSLQGHLEHIAQIDPRFVSKAKGSRARFKSQLKVA